MIKYLKTLNNEGKLVIHKIFGCEDCILMSYDKKIAECKCRCFSGEKDNIVLDNVAVYYNNKEYVFEHIDIPSWCGLSKSLDEIAHGNGKLYITDNNSKVYILNKDADFINKEIKFLLPKRTFDIYKYKDIITCELLADDISYVLNYKPQSIEEIINNMNIIDNNSEEIEIKEETEETEIKLNICSNCGEKKQNINRNINFGMCEECWINNSNNENVKKKSFINNFRLKRNYEYSDKQYKLV